MGNFESFRFEATVELDNTEYKDHTFEDLLAEADKMLGQALALEIKEASEVTMTKDSFILTMELN